MPCRKWEVNARILTTIVERVGLIAGDEKVASLSWNRTQSSIDKVYKEDRWIDIFVKKVSKSNNYLWLLKQCKNSHLIKMLAGINLMNYYWCINKKAVTFVIEWICFLCIMGKIYSSQGVKICKKKSIMCVHMVLFYFSKVLYNCVNISQTCSLYLL